MSKLPDQCAVDDQLAGTVDGRIGEASYESPCTHATIALGVVIHCHQLYLPLSQATRYP